MNDKNFNLLQYLEHKQAIINQYLKSILQDFNQERELIKAMSHSLMAGGKRIRPVLSIASAQACGKDFHIALPACCAIELIHTYSLIHDDLPAMDDDDLRRGLPSCHKKFSESTAILAGDALLTHAFYILSQPGHIFKLYPETSIRLRLISIISRAAGVQGMVEGQILDMQSSHSEQMPDLEFLKKIHSLKTGQMITASVLAGAVSVGAGSEITDKLILYSKKIGLAFQVIDDILNIEGDPEITGKSSGSDALNEKMTFPAVIGLDESKKYAKTLVDDAVQAISHFDDKAIALRAIARYIINREY